jgi:hypothetical protein
MWKPSGYCTKFLIKGRKARPKQNKTKQNKREAPQILILILKYFVSRSNNSKLLNMSDAAFDPDQFTKAGAITKSYYRDVYPTIDPTKPELSLAGKVTVVTGAGKGIGRVRNDS